MSEAEQPADHVADDGVARAEKSDFEKNVRERSTWIRVLFMILSWITASIAALILMPLIIINFGYVLFTSKPNDTLTSLGNALGRYMLSCIEFLTWNSDLRPFPFEAEWPDGEPQSQEAATE